MDTTNTPAAPAIDPMKPLDLPEIPMHGPVEINMTVHMMTQDGRPARMTMVLNPGVFPSHDEIQEIIDGCLDSEDATIPAGTRLMTKPEFVAHITEREAGIPMVMPGSQQWESPLAVEKPMLIHAIIGRGVPARDSDSWEKAGMARFTGNQHNPGWDWDMNVLNEMSCAELLDLYVQIKKP